MTFLNYCSTYIVLCHTIEYYIEAFLLFYYTCYRTYIVLYSGGYFPDAVSGITFRNMWDSLNAQVGGLH